MMFESYLYFLSLCRLCATVAVLLVPVELNDVADAIVMIVTVTVTVTVNEIAIALTAFDAVAVDSKLMHSIVDLS